MANTATLTPAALVPAELRTLRAAVTDLKDDLWYATDRALAITIAAELRAARARAAQFLSTPAGQRYLRALDAR